MINMLIIDRFGKVKEPTFLYPGKPFIGKDERLLSPLGECPQCKCVGRAGANNDQIAFTCVVHRDYQISSRSLFCASIAEITPGK